MKPSLFTLCILPCKIGFSLFCTHPLTFPAFVRPLCRYFILVMCRHCGTHSVLNCLYLVLNLSFLNLCLFLEFFLSYLLKGHFDVASFNPKLPLLSPHQSITRTLSTHHREPQRVGLRLFLSSQVAYDLFEGNDSYSF